MPQLDRFNYVQFSPLFFFLSLSLSVVVFFSCCHSNDELTGYVCVFVCELFVCVFVLRRGQRDTSLVNDP